MDAPTEALTLAAPLGTAAAILVLLGVSALLVASEMALTAAHRGRLHGLADRGVAGAAVALALSQDKERLLDAVRLGTTAANVLATVLGAGLLGHLLPHGGTALAVVGMTLLILVFAHLLPRASALAAPEAVAARLSRPVRPLVAVLAPVALAVRRVAGIVLRPLRNRPVEPAPAFPGADPSDRPAEPDDREVLLGALNLADRQVEEVMMHRRDIEMIDADAPPEEILTQAIASPHTRLPIFRGEPENIVGVIHAKDLSRAVHAFVRKHQAESALEGFDVMDVAMEPYFIPESTTLEEQLHEFLRRRSHFALVVDEYGALQGLVTLEDILEEIVGDIADEHDVEEPGGIEPQPDGSVEVEGNVPIRDLNRACDWDLPDEEANTIAGLVIHEAQSIPSEGEAFSFHGFRFEVLAREHNRLTRLRVRKLV